MKNGLNPNTFRVQATESNNMLKPLVNKGDDISDSLSSTNEEQHKNNIINSDKNIPEKITTEENNSTSREETTTTTQKSNEFFQAKVEKWACVTDGPFDFSK